MISTRVIVVGAGPGGLLAANGLARLGVDVLVLERDTSLASRPQGYRINIDPAGDDAVRAWLPASHVRVYDDTAHQQRDPVVEIYDTGLRPVLHRVAEAPEEGRRPPSAVDRTVLRAILLDPIADRVVFGAGVERADERPDGTVRLHCTDGRRFTADLVVAADGARSVLRDRRLPGAAPAPLGTVGLYGRAPLDPDRAAWLPAGVRDSRFVGVTDGAGVSLALGAWNPRCTPAQSSRRHLGHTLPDVERYVMWVLLGPAMSFPGPGSTPAGLLDFARAQTANWHRAATQFVDDAIEADTFRVTLQAVTAVPRWDTGSITYLGDAIHAMSPAGGQGANTALADAASLCRHIGAALAAGRPLTAHIGRYEKELRDRADHVLDRSRRLGPPAVGAA